MPIDRRLLTRLDWRLVLPALLIALLGIIAIYSGTDPTASPFRRSLYMRQALWILLGSVAMFLVCIPHYRTFTRFVYPLYGLTVLLLLIVLVIGRTGSGAQRWLHLGAFAFQPSEFMKLILILTLARYYDDHRGEIHRLRTFLPPLLLTLLPVGLVLRQPDLGTALLLLLLAAVMTLLAGFKIRYLVAAATVGAATFPFLWPLLKGYQQKRLLVFLNPSLDPLGAGYHVAQSKIAVGSGGLTGKGWMAATQSRLNFLPENHTDFIFAVIAEQWGFIGSLILLLLYALLLSRSLELAREAPDIVAAHISAGIVATFALQILINIGMVIGITPVVGIPLPLLSYGGSAMVASLMALGLLLNIQIRRLMY